MGMRVMGKSDGHSDRRMAEEKNSWSKVELFRQCASFINFSAAREPAKEGSIIFSGRKKNVMHSTLTPDRADKSDHGKKMEYFNDKKRGGRATRKKKMEVEV